MVSSNNDSNKSKSFHTHPWFLELNNDDRALAKRIYKLIEQVQVNETEIDSIQRKSAVAIVEKEELDKKLEAVTASKDKVMALYTALQNRNEELREESAKQTLEEKTRREELSESFSSTISEITARMDKDTQDRLQVLARNEALKQELRDHEEHIQNFLKTYEQQYTTLETEHRMLELKKHFLIERFEKDSAMLPELEEKEKEARELHDTKKSELQDLTNNFEKLQKDISDSTQWFQKHQSEIDRLTKRLKILDTERQDAYKKMQKAEKECLAIIEEKEEAGNQLKRIESATVLLQQQIDTLKNEVRDQKTPGKE